MPLIPRVKICGVTTPVDVRAVADAGADAIGLNFVPSSPRYVEPRAAAELLRALPPFVDAVGVFTGPLRQACAIAYQLGLRGVQWYGDDADPGDASPFALIRAYRVRDAASLDTIRAHGRARQPAAVLLDAYVEGHLGGTGHVAPWDLLRDFDVGVPLILAGGLRPENVAEAVRQLRPYAVDVASGVEISPGRKDIEAVRQFIRAARNAAVEPAEQSGGPATGSA
jgi:phosphoribosylanthranilate isomerase